MAFATKPTKTSEPAPASGCCRWCTWGGDFGKKVLATLVGVVLVYLTFYLGTLMRNNVKKYNFIGQAPQTERTITVSGYGKVSGKNDIAVTTVGFSNVDMDVAKAQMDNKKVMDPVMTELKKMGFDDKDLESNYSITPQYNFTPEKGQTLVGYQVFNNVQIKIRDLSKIPDVLTLPGKYGATQVGGLSFSIDDPESLKAGARDKAIVDAEKKALRLANQLGVAIVEVLNYNEYDVAQPYPMMNYASDTGGMMMEKASGAPATIASGGQDVGMNVSVTYKIVSPTNYYSY